MASVWQDAKLLTVTSGHSREFLQGYLSSNTDRIVDGQAVPMTICNLKGRVLCSGWALDRGEDVGLIVHASLTERVSEFLKPYVTFSKCELVDANEALVADDDGFDLGAGFRVKPVENSALGDTADDYSSDALSSLTAARFVFVEAATSEQFLPQMLGLHDAGAVDFDKGCYLGQEIVARAQFRGAVKRSLATASIPANSVALGEQTEDGATLVQLAADGSALVVASS